VLVIGRWAVAHSLSPLPFGTSVEADMHSYSIHGHGRMIADRNRVDAYARALRQAIQPGSVVAEIGTGIGIFGLLACQLGARRVYAIESDDIVQVAREIAATSGCAERIEFIQGLSMQVSLPERADVIISDLRGLLPWFEHHIPAIVDARRRFLAPGGVLIPQRDTLWAAVVEAPEHYGLLVGPWAENQFGYDLRPARRISTNTWQKARVSPEQLLTEPQCWGTLDYATLEEPDFATELTYKVARAGTASGLLVWFDSILAENVQFSNSPWADELIYGSALFPWSEETSLCLGDTLCVGLAAHLVGKDYVWRWETRVFHQGNRSEMKAHFQQSSFFGVPLSSERLRKLDASHAPRLNEEGQIDQFILTEMDGRTSLRVLADRLAERFPNRFASWKNALDHIVKLSQKYSR